MKIRVECVPDSGTGFSGANMGTFDTRVRREKEREKNVVFKRKQWFCQKKKGETIRLFPIGIDAFSLPDLMRIKEREKERNGEEEKKEDPSES